MNRYNNKRLNTSLNLILSSDPRRRKRGWSIYRQLHRHSISNAQIALEKFSIAAHRAGIQLNKMHTQMLEIDNKEI